MSIEIMFSSMFGKEGCLPSDSIDSNKDYHCRDSKFLDLFNKQIKIKEQGLANNSWSKNKLQFYYDDRESQSSSYWILFNQSKENLAAIVVANDVDLVFSIKSLEDFINNNYSYFLSVNNKDVDHINELENDAIYKQDLNNIANGVRKEVNNKDVDHHINELENDAIYKQDLNNIANGVRKEVNNKDVDHINELENDAIYKQDLNNIANGVRKEVNNKDVDHINELENDAIYKQDLNNVVNGFNFKGIKGRKYNCLSELTISRNLRLVHLDNNKVNNISKILLKKSVNDNKDDLLLDLSEVRLKLLASLKDSNTYSNNDRGNDKNNQLFFSKENAFLQQINLSFNFNNLFNYDYLLNSYKQVLMVLPYVINNGNKEINIKLYPRHLGEVNIKVYYKGEGKKKVIEKITFFSKNNETINALENNKSILSKMLNGDHNNIKEENILQFKVIK